MLQQALDLFLTTFVPLAFLLLLYHPDVQNYVCESIGTEPSSSIGPRFGAPAQRARDGEASCSADEADAAATCSGPVAASSAARAAAAAPAPTCAHSLLTHLIPLLLFLLLLYAILRALFFVHLLRFYQRLARRERPSFYYYCYRDEHGRVWKHVEDADEQGGAWVEVDPAEIEEEQEALMHGMEEAYADEDVYEQKHRYTDIEAGPSASPKSPSHRSRRHSPQRQVRYFCPKQVDLTPAQATATSPAAVPLASLPTIVVSGSAPDSIEKRSSTIDHPLAADQADASTAAVVGLQQRETANERVAAWQRKVSLEELEQYQEQDDSDDGRKVSGDGTRPPF